MQTYRTNETHKMNGVKAETCLLTSRAHTLRIETQKRIHDLIETISDNFNATAKDYGARSLIYTKLWTAFTLDA